MESSQPRNRTWVFCTAAGFFTIWATREVHQCRRPGFHSWVGKIPWRREWLESDITEWLIHVILKCLWIHVFKIFLYYFMSSWKYFSFFEQFFSLLFILRYLSSFIIGLTNLGRKSISFSSEFFGWSSN